MSVFAMRSTHIEDVNFALEIAEISGGSTFWTINRKASQVNEGDIIIIFSGKGAFGNDRNAWEHQTAMVGTVSRYTNLPHGERFWPSSDEVNYEYVHQYLLQDTQPVTLNQLEEFGKIDSLRQFVAAAKLR